MLGSINDAAFDAFGDAAWQPSSPAVSPRCAGKSSILSVAGG